MIKIAIIESLQIVREGLISLLEQSKEIKVVLSTDTGIEMLEQLELMSVLPDVCLLDVNMKTLDCCVVLKVLKEKFASIKTIAISISTKDYYLFKMIIDGVDDSHSKENSIDLLIKKIKEVVQVDKSPESSARSLENYMRRPPIPILNETEMEYLKHLCDDLTNKEIAEKMGKSVRTVENYRDELLKKLNVKSRVGIVVFALKSLQIGNE